MSDDTDNLCGIMIDTDGEGLLTLSTIVQLLPLLVKPHQPISPLTVLLLVDALCPRSENASSFIDKQISEDLFITAITIAEIDYDLSILPDGAARSLLRTSFEKVVEEAFSFRVLSFDSHAARFYGPVMNHRKKLGMVMSLFDGQIASIAQAHNAAVATRNVNDFGECGLTVINPFAA